jgi:hypothetical protein
MSQIDKLKDIIYIYKNIVDRFTYPTFIKFSTDLDRIKEIQDSLQKFKEFTEGKTTINTTLKINNHNVTEFENWLSDKFDLISFQHLENTDKMYQEDEHFKKLVKLNKELKNKRIDYILNNNHKYK